MRSAAIALLNPHWHSVSIDGVNQPVTPTVTYEQVPLWFKQVSADDLAKTDLGEHADDEFAYCLFTRYESADESSHDCANADGSDIPPNDSARRELQTASLMLWLSKRSSFGFDRIVIAHELEEGWTWKELTSHDIRVALPSYSNQDIEALDFSGSMFLAKNYSHTKPQQTIQTACHALGMALTQSDWPLRYLTLWLVLESLFGPQDARETTFRLCQRMALFLAPRGELAKTLFKQLNESYRWRSKIVHGMRLQKLEAPKSVELLEALEGWVHGALKQIISDKTLIATFDSVNREIFLDELALNP